MSSPAFDLNEIVRAGAGAGKTRALTLQVMNMARQFLQKEGHLPRVVVTTFTRKATQELRERLMLQAIESYPELIDFVNSRSHLVVSTIHGVLDLYLKRYGGNICIDPSYKVIGRIEVARVARTALRSVLFDEAKYQAFLEIFDFRLLVRLCRSYHELKLKDPAVGAHNLETLEKAFGEISASLSLELQESAACIKAEAQGSQMEGWLDLSERFSAISWALREVPWGEGRPIAIEQLADLMRKPTHSSKSPCVSDETNEQADDLLKQIRKFIEAHDAKTWPEFAETFSRFAALAEKFSERFSKTKIDQGALEISDLELLSMDCIRRHPHTSHAFTDEWDYWLIDEYQDTSPFQVELLKALIGSKPAFIVGDPQQSIYLFRGARSEVFAQKENEILQNGGKRSFLTTNYRSRPELLNFFNDVFNRFDPPFEPMQTHPDLPSDRKAEIATFFIAPKPERKNSDGTELDFESEAIVSYVDGLLQKGAKPDSICILGRTHKTLSEIAERLMAAQMPVHIHSAAGFYDRREIQDALAFLRFLINPHDNFNLVELLRSPWFRLSDDLIARHAAGPLESLWSELRETPESEDFEAVRRLQNWLALRSIKGVAVIFREGLIESGLLDSAHRHDLTGRREANLWKLISRLSHEEARSGFNPLEFVNSSLIALKDDDGSEESDAIAAVEPNRINLMTIHASKGLAFDHVIVPRLQQRPRLTTHDEFLFDEDRKLWSLRVPMGEERKATPSPAEAVWLNTFRKQERQEHARVLYVALTRARHSVFLSWTEPSQEDSWASGFKLDLTEGLHQTESYAYRVLREMDGVGEREAPPPQAVRLRAAWSQVDQTIKGPQNKITEIFKTISVSQILEDQNQKQKLGRTGQKTSSDSSSLGTQPTIIRRIQVASQGTAVHRLMEMMKYRSRTQIEILIRQWFPEQIDRVTKAIGWVGEVQEAPLSELIDKGFVEWGFAFLEKGRLIEGQVDLWGRAPSTGEVWIIDYKTGNPEMRETAFAQMTLYSQAIRRSGQIKPGEKIRMAAVYPFAEKIFVREAN